MVTPRPNPLDLSGLDQSPDPSARLTAAEELADSLRQFQAQSAAKPPRPSVTPRSLTQIKITQRDGDDLPAIKIGNYLYQLRTPDEAATVALTPVSTVLWPKDKRHEFDFETKQLFHDFATKPVLPKNDKLSLPNYKTNDDGTLQGIHHRSTQLYTLFDHLHAAGLDDVFNIVVPGDLANSAALRPGSYNLFDDYLRLTPAHVANSNVYWRRYVKAPWIAENMQFSFEFLKANTTPSLFEKCMEDYRSYNEEQQGGPLMMHLLLERIQNKSESTILILQAKVKSLSLKTITNEDVDTAVSYIKDAHKAFIGASRPDKSFVPDDFPETIFKIFQTSSTPQFNDVFRKMYDDLQTAADMTGGLPEWPSVSSLTNLATKTYQRLLVEDVWIKPTPTALVGESGTGTRPKGKCFNCGGDHLLPQCTQPRDEAKIKAARDAFAANRPPRTGRTGGRPPSGSPKHKMGKGGRPLILNKQGAYVTDTKRWKALKDKAKSDSTTASDTVFQSYVASTPSGSQSTAPTAPVSELTDDVTVSFNRSAFAAAVARARGL